MFCAYRSGQSGSAVNAFGPVPLELVLASTLTPLIAEVHKNLSKITREVR